MSAGPRTRVRMLSRGGLIMVAALWSTSAAPSPDPSALNRFDIRKGAATQFRLPRGLREISGLAVTADGRLLAHGDELGIISELNPRTGAVVKSFTLGSPPARNDFEGIAVAGERIFLMTSRGLLYETREGASGEAMRFTVTDTRFGPRCELEGLAFEPSDRSLLVGCKRPYDRKLHGAVTIFRWSIDRGQPATPAAITISLPDIIKGTGEKAFHQSSLEREPRTGHYVLVAGPQRVLAEVTRTGAVVATRSLPRSLHRQPEGLTFIGDSTLVIGDEGGSGYGTLTTYPHAR